MIEFARALRQIKLIEEISKKDFTNDIDNYSLFSKSENIIPPIKFRVIGQVLSPNEKPTCKGMTILLDNGEFVEIQIHEKWIDDSFIQGIYLASETKPAYLIQTSITNTLLEVNKPILYKGAQHKIDALEPTYTNFTEKDFLNILAYFRKFEYLKIISSFGIKNDRKFGDWLLSQVLEGKLARILDLEVLTDQEYLKRSFIAYNFNYLQPLVYHQYQVDEIKSIFDPLISKNGKAQQLLEKVLQSECKTFDNIRDDFFALFPGERAKLGDIRRVVSGGSLLMRNTRPPWFDDDFIDRWHVLLQSFFNYATSLFPGLPFEIKDSTRAILGKHFDLLKFLFIMPTVNFTILTSHMPWDMVDPDQPMYFGFTSFGPGTKAPKGNFNIEYVEKYVYRDIAIHPLVLFTCEYFSWKELVLNIMYHELIHILQQRYVQNYMTYMYLDDYSKPQKRLVQNQFLHENFSFLDKIVNDVDLVKLKNLCKENLGLFFIREILPEQFQGEINLDEYVMWKGGHTQAFLDLVQKYPYREVAFKQRNYTMKFINNLAVRLYGKSFGEKIEVFN